MEGALFDTASPSGRSFRDQIARQLMLKKEEAEGKGAGGGTVLADTLTTVESSSANRALFQGADPKSTSSLCAVEGENKAANNDGIDVELEWFREHIQELKQFHRDGRIKVRFTRKPCRVSGSDLSYAPLLCFCSVRAQGHMHDTCKLNNISKDFV